MIIVQFCDEEIMISMGRILLWKQNTELKQEAENGVEQNAASGEESEDVVAKGNEADIAAYYRFIGNKNITLEASQIFVL